MKRHGAGSRDPGKEKKRSVSFSEDVDVLGEAESLKKEAEVGDDTSQRVSKLIGAIFILVSVYGSAIVVGRKAMYMGFVVPLSSNANLDRFSEGRAMDHVKQLAGLSPGRQEGNSGLSFAAAYLKKELYSLKERSSSNIRLEVDESFVNGSFNFVFLKHSINLVYRNHPNIAVRVSAKDADANASALLLNAHFDAPLGSPGAADCASCVASLLEALRYIVDTTWVPPAPIIFLFNGAEELFLLASHGFITTHKWRASIGAVINLEASGACGPDLVVQSGPGDWPSRVYYESAVYPMASSAAQDVFPLIPGDTDYRIFSQDFGDVPGLDLVFILKGYVYHTAYDRPEVIVPGSLQARGENLLSLIQGFTTAPELKGASEREQENDVKGKSYTARPVFFDLWGLWMVYYPHNVASALHLFPLGVVLLAPSLTQMSTFPSVFNGFYYILQGGLVQIVGLVFAVIFPVLLAVIRLSVSSTAMTWFAQPWVGVFIFGPSAVVGLLLPRILWIKSSAGEYFNQEALDWASHWGSVGVSSLATAVVTLSGGSGYLDFMWAFFMLPALSIFQRFQLRFGQHSLLALLSYMLGAVIPIAYSVYFGGVLIQFVAEKMGMSGSIPQAYGYYLADAIFAALTGAVVAVGVGPIMPIVGNYIGKPNVIRFLLYLSIGAAALSSRMFPYSYDAPKRLVFQHTFRTTGGTEIVESSYDFATIDSNSVEFVWKNAPGVATLLHQMGQNKALVHDATVFTALYPISKLITQGASVQLVPSNMKRRLPHIQVLGKKIEQNVIRLDLQLDLGDLNHVWAAVMNITGHVVNWSFAQLQVPDAGGKDGGPPSYICRLSGRSGNENWQFWIEASNLEPVIQIELAVLDQHLDTQTEDLVTSFPSWVAVTAGASYLSSYTF